MGQGGVATGHWVVPLHFRNASTTACALYGYPGVALLNAAGQEVAQAQRTPVGYAGGLRTGSSNPPTAILAPGLTATALVEGTDAPRTGPVTSCPVYSGMLVTPPTTTESVRLTLRLRPLIGCSPVEVHPVIATRSTTTPGSTVSHLTVTELTVVGMTVSEASAVTLGTGRHLELQLTREQVDAAVPPDTIVHQGAVGSSLNPSATSPVLVDVTVAVPTAPSCRPTQVAMAYLGGQGLAGGDTGIIGVRDTSPTWCSLTGPVEVWGQAATGRAVTNTLTDVVPTPVVLSPLDEVPQPLIPLTTPGVVQAAVEFASYLDNCSAPVIPATFVMSAPGDITLSAPNRSYTTDGLSRFGTCDGLSQVPTPVTAR